MTVGEVSKGQEGPGWSTGVKASLPTAGGTDAKAARAGGTSPGHPALQAEGLRG